MQSFVFWRWFNRCAAWMVLIFLMAPILVIIPLSFNGGSFLSFPMDGWSLRWYQQVFNSPQWLFALKNSVLIGVASMSLATVLGTLAALGLNLADFRMKALLMAVLLFSPTIVDPVKTQFAPAVAITAMDLVLKVGNNAWRAVADLALYSLIALAVYLVFVAVRWPIERWWKGRKSEQVSEPDEDPRTLRERMEEDDDLPIRDYERDRSGRMEPRI